MALSKKRVEMGATGIGASEIGVLANLSNWSTPIAIFARKLQGLNEDVGLAGELGEMFEGPVSNKYHKETGLYLARAGTIRHPDPKFSLAICTPDRIAFAEKRESRAKLVKPEDFVEAERNVQIKTASIFERAKWGEYGSDVIPDAYIAQVQWEMGITGLKTTDLPVLFDRYDWAIFRVPFNEQLFLGLYEIGARFWRDHVMTGVPPPVDASDSYRDFLQRQFGDTRSKILTPVESGSSLDCKVRRYAALKAIEKFAEDELKLLGNELRLAIGENHGLIGEWGSVKWLRADAKMRTDWEAIARAVIPPDELGGYIAAHQVNGNPYSQLRAYWSKDYQPERLLAAEAFVEREAITAVSPTTTEDSHVSN